MISIELTDTKDFMNKLLRTEIFDNFLLQEPSSQRQPHMS